MGTLLSFKFKGRGSDALLMIVRDRGSYEVPGAYTVVVGAGEVSAPSQPKKLAVGEMPNLRP